MKKRTGRISAFVLITVPTGKVISDTAVEKLATTLKVDKTKLEEALVVEAKDEKAESKITEVIPKLTILDETEKNTLLDNHGKTKYDEGRFAEREMKLKELSKKVGLPESIKDYDVFLTEYEKKIKATGNIPTDAKVLELEKEKGILQQDVVARDKEIERLKDEMGGLTTKTQINSEVERGVNLINIDADDTMLAGQREMLTNAFLMKHEIKIEDGKKIVYRDGKKLVDNLQNPISISDALNEFAPKYVKVKVPTGRNDKSTDPTLGLSGDLAEIKDKATFEAYLAKNNIVGTSEKAQAILRELKTKNPNFKLA